ncbi:hypothetical protein JYU34_006420 [Plutella xylostella]|uniref:Uncharacterized protein n=1 Tax=Plutella xylostella TaxID=51655 RepID=A0ABQ7QRZ7_PLUXY|nr:hypothetical protein JYU34_006420 [Plutella xylostella]
MSARNYFSAREKNCNKFIDLPSINPQKFYYRGGYDLPALSATTNSFINRNINYSFEVQSFDVNLDNIERSGTPFSDFFSESETGTPDFHSEESDSSTGSILRKNTAEATKTLADEWEKIERTIYNEDGEKSKRPEVIEECEQWKQLHPQLRVVGKAIQLPEKKLNYRQIETDEVIAMHYSDYEEFSEGAERLSQSSTDVTPQNSPRVSVCDFTEPKLSREKVTFSHKHDNHDLPDDFCSMLTITPLHARSPSRRRQNSSILKSEIASSRWMRNNRPDSSVNCDRNSAKSFMSLDTRNFNMALSARDRNKVMNRVVTAKPRDGARLEPLYTPESNHNDVSRLSSSRHGIHRKVSLPPLLLEEEKRKMGSAKKHSCKSKKAAQRNLFHFDRVKHI